MNGCWTANYYYDLKSQQVVHIIFPIQVVLTHEIKNLK